LRYNVRVLRVFLRAKRGPRARSMRFYVSRRPPAPDGRPRRRPPGAGFTAYAWALGTFLASRQKRGPADLLRIYVSRRSSRVFCRGPETRLSCVFAVCLRLSNFSHPGPARAFAAYARCLRPVFGRPGALESAIWAPAARFEGADARAPDAYVPCFRRGAAPSRRAPRRFSCVCAALGRPARPAWSPMRAQFMRIYGVPACFGLAAAGAAAVFMRICGILAWFWARGGVRQPAKSSTLHKCSPRFDAYVSRSRPLRAGKPTFLRARSSAFYAYLPHLGVGRSSERENRTIHAYLRWFGAFGRARRRALRLPRGADFVRRNGVFATFAGLAPSLVGRAKTRFWHVCAALGACWGGLPGDPPGGRWGPVRAYLRCFRAARQERHEQQACFHAQVPRLGMIWGGCVAPPGRPCAGRVR